MNRREFVISTSSVAVGLFTPFRAAGQKRTIAPDLGLLADGEGLNASNRTISRLADENRRGVRLSESQGEAPAYVAVLELPAGGAAERRLAAGVRVRFPSTDQ